VGKIASLASEGKKESLLHGQGGRGRVPYYADNVFADQTEQYPEICETLTGSRKHVLSSFMLLYIFLDFCFYNQINTARGMVVNDNEIKE
jgi:hypothetical protein